MPMLSELRRTYEKSSSSRLGHSSHSERETVEIDSRSGLSPSELVERKLEATLSEKRERRSLLGILSSIPR